MLNYLKVTLKNSSYRFNYKRFELSLGVKLFFFLTQDSILEVKFIVKVRVK